VDAAVPLGSGIGERSALLEVDGKPVFVKRVPLTDMERLPEHVRSTANLFGLPTFCQYGVGGPGFGAWRELAVHIMTTNWVLGGRYQGFPMMYHWRMLPDVVPALPMELADVERAVAYWGGLVGEAKASAIGQDVLKMSVEVQKPASIHEGQRPRPLLPIRSLTVRGQILRTARVVLIRACAEGEDPPDGPQVLAVRRWR
jgi:hypothetical protein